MAIQQVPTAAGGNTYLLPLHAVGSASTVSAAGNYAAGLYIATPSAVSGWSFTVGSYTKTFTTGDALTTFLFINTSNATSMSMTAPATYLGWAAGTPAANQSLVTALIYGGTKYVAGSQVGTVYNSTDGITWTVAASNAIGTNYTIYDIAYNATPTNKYVACGEQGGLATSTDAVTWTVRSAGFGASTIQAVAAGTTTEKYLICGTYADGLAPNAKSSTDGVTWSVRTVTATTCNGLSLAFGGVWVLTGQSGNLFTSTDAVTWTSRTSGSAVSLAVTYVNSLYWTVDANGVLRNSTDAITWTQRATGLGGYSAGAWRGKFNIIYFNSKYHYVGNASKISQSTDGITWGTLYGSSYIGLATNGTTAAIGTGYYSTTGNIVTTTDITTAFQYLGASTTGA